MRGEKGSEIIRDQRCTAPGGLYPILIPDPFSQPFLRLGHNRAVGIRRSGAIEGCLAIYAGFLKVQLREASAD